MEKTAKIFYGKKQTGKTFYINRRITYNLENVIIVPGGEFMKYFEEQLTLPLKYLLADLIVVDECQKDFPIEHLTPLIEAGYKLLFVFHKKPRIAQQLRKFFQLRRFFMVVDKNKKTIYRSSKINW